MESIRRDESVPGKETAFVLQDLFLLALEPTVQDNRTVNPSAEKHPEQAVSVIGNVEKKRPLPDAIFAANDDSAFGCMKALMEAGYSVPEDVSVLGQHQAAVPQGK